MKRIVYLLMAVIALSSCAPSATSETEQTVEDPLAAGQASTIELTSTAFDPGQPIPPQYACQGGGEKDASPPLAWGEPPEGTQSFALIMDDPDAPGGTWDHWVIFNIPATERGLPESVSANPALPEGGLSGNNSWGRTGYGGPCPPSGTHRYFFKLYALDEMLAISAGATSGELEKAMVGHVLAQGELMGTFSK